MNRELNSDRNVAQIILSIFLLKSRQISILKTSLIGGILTMVLLNTGIAFCVGGYTRFEQFFNISVANTVGYLLTFSMSTLVMPFTFSALLHVSDSNISALSHGLAIIVIVLYLGYLLFQLLTHRDMMEEKSRKVAKIPGTEKVARGDPRKRLAIAGAILAAQGRPTRYDSQYEELFEWTAQNKGEESPLMSKTTTLVSLVLGTTILAFHTQYLTDSIAGLMESTKVVTESFIGIVLLPFLSNDLVAIQGGLLDNMDIAILAALGKSCQTTLLVLPFLVLLGWAMGADEMNFRFDGFQVTLVFVAAYLVQVTISNGKSHR
jgi:Ca2+:H+ antiporter